MTKPILLTALLLLAGCASSPPLHKAGAGTSSPDAALHQLMDGNARFVANRPINGGSHAARRAEVAKGQKPIAVIVCCSDSRVGPELVFDQDLGDIFVVRTAGNVVADVEMGSIEYAVDHLHATLILVAGHERCGAVTAAVEGGHAPGHVGAITHLIDPAVAKSKGQPGDAVENAVTENVREVVNQLATADPILSAHVKDGSLKVVGARYDLDTGKVEIVK